jgi:hypothetical protein
VADLDAVVRGLMREVGAALRPLGFRGSGGVWRLSTPEGVGVVQKQAYQGSPRGTTRFFMNTAVVPAVWWEWKRGSGEPIDKAGEADGVRLLEGRVPWTDPANGYGRDAGCWQVTAGTDVDMLRADLVAGVVRAGDRLVELLRPDRYLDELRALPTKQIGHWQPLVVLLAAHGPSPELDAACAGLRATFAERPGSSAYVERLIGWARARAGG